MESILTWINSHVWIVSIITLVLGAFLNAILTKNKDVLIKVADKKSQYYAEYIRALLEFSKPIQLLEPEQRHEINRNYMYFKNLVILYGSDNVIEKCAICEKHGQQFGSLEGQERYIELIKAMKEDVENPKIIKSWLLRKTRTSNLDENIADIMFNYKK
ncbi:hypothetical protein [Bacillus mycoides]|uniref:hypothetical protein n=1 Tax=Bacillus mycoides TaxID=1405 RepID=UPI0025A0DBF1|nr:hypothetical protein [Bacillus mycoides]MDM5425997.1 hypothetical protein [Bacillus mycoides]